MIALSHHDVRSIRQDGRTVTTIWRNGKTVATRNLAKDEFLQWTTAQDYVRIIRYKQKSPQRLHR